MLTAYLWMKSARRNGVSGSAGFAVSMSISHHASQAAKAFYPSVILSLIFFTVANANIVHGVSLRL